MFRIVKKGQRYGIGKVTLLYGGVMVAYYLIEPVHDLESLMQFMSEMLEASTNDIVEDSSGTGFVSYGLKGNTEPPPVELWNDREVEGGEALSATNDDTFVRRESITNDDTFVWRESITNDDTFVRRESTTIASKE